MQAQHICDTLTWLPAKIPMPSASSIDHILAGIANIAHALKHPLPNTPLAPLADSQSAALCKIMEVINGTIPTALAKTTHLQPATTAPAPPLRVQSPIAIVALTPDTQEAILIPPDDDDDAALRVEPTPPWEPSPTIIPPDNDDVTTPQSNHTHPTPPLPAQFSQLAWHP